MKISVVIPLYFSENTLPILIETIFSELSTFDFEVIIVNDGSTDATTAIALELCRKYRCITFIELSRNFGQHNALMAGFRYASGDVIVTMDDDLQHPPGQIHRLISELNKGYDVVYGAFSRKKHSIFRNIGSKCNDIMATLLLNKPKDLYFSPFRAMRKYVVDEISKYNASYPYIDGLVFRVTRNIGTVTVEHDIRQFGKSNYTFRKLVRLWLNMFTNFSIVPLRISTLLGLLLSLVAFIFALYIIYEKIFFGAMPSGWASLMTGMCFFAGAQLAAIGLVGEYVGRIFMVANKTPQYVVRGTESNRLKDLRG